MHSSNKQIATYSVDQLPEVVMELLPLLSKGAVVALHGAMGVGKTTLVSSLCRQLGVEDPVNSPTFAIVNEYHSPEIGMIFHFDFYRINTIEEAIAIGVEDYFQQAALSLIEWPEKVQELLPPDTIHITIEEQPDSTRSLTLVCPIRENENKSTTPLSNTKKILPL